MAWTPISLGTTADDHTGTPARDVGARLNTSIPDLEAATDAARALADQALATTVIPVGQTRPAGLGQGDLWVKVNF
jgi:hypothetical protein